MLVLLYGREGWFSPVLRAAGFNVVFAFPGACSPLPQQCQLPDSSSTSERSRPSAGCAQRQVTVLLLVAEEDFLEEDCSTRDFTGVLLSLSP